MTQNLLRTSLLLCLINIAWSSHWYVYPSTYTGGDGTGTSKTNAFKGLLGINPVVIQPGDTLFLLSDKGYFTAYPGEFLYLSVSGTAQAPIVITHEAGETPVLDSSLILVENQASYLIVDGLTVRNSALTAAILRGGASHITLQNCVFSNSAQGVSIDSNAGDDNIISACTMADNDWNGIAINKHICRLGHESLITGCDITGNGCHGIEVNGDHYRIESSTFHNNGGKVTGTRAILF
jgi:hypothetical protein